LIPSAVWMSWRCSLRAAPYSERLFERPISARPAPAEQVFGDKVGLIERQQFRAELTAFSFRFAQPSQVLIADISFGRLACRRVVGSGHIQGVQKVLDDISPHFGEPTKWLGDALCQKPATDAAEGTHDEGAEFDSHSCAPTPSPAASARCGAIDDLRGPAAVVAASDTESAWLASPLPFHPRSKRDLAPAPFASPLVAQSFLGMPACFNTALAVWRDKMV
jgi:hypothetical protein